MPGDYDNNYDDYAGDDCDDDSDDYDDYDEGDEHDHFTCDDLNHSDMIFFQTMYTGKYIEHDHFTQ